MPSPPRSRCALHTPSIRACGATLAYRCRTRTCVKSRAAVSAAGLGRVGLRLAPVVQGPALDPSCCRFLAGNHLVGVVAVTLVAGFQFGDLAVVADVPL